MKTRISFGTRTWLRMLWLGAAVCLAVPAWAAESAAAPKQTACNGTFSTGAVINVANPANLADVPGDQSFCDFHTFAWNQFIYLTRAGSPGAPPFMQMAPWYNVLGKANPTAYPGGDTSLQAGTLSKGQAGTSAQLKDVQNAVVLYDIRFSRAMYDAIVKGGLNTKTGYTNACDASGPPSRACTKPIWMPPVDTKAQEAPGALEVKTAWRDFGSPAACPADTFYCAGRFGLVGLHLVQKTVTHGEWLWASFEHVANTPDCTPDGDTPIAALSPNGKTPWSFFSPKTAGPDVMNKRICSVVAGGPPQCNTNPKGSDGVYKQVNVCRTAVLPPGGATAKNCAVPVNPNQDTANNEGNVACLNATFQPRLAGVWKNYKMIGSLWILHTTGPTEQFRVQGFQSPVPGIRMGLPAGFPHMANSTMETWLQPGSTYYDPLKNNASQAGCFYCHNLPATSGSADLSHFPRKLPPAMLNKFLKSLVPANSSKPVNAEAIKPIEE